MPSFQDALHILITADGKQAIGEMNRVGSAAKTQIGGAEGQTRDWGGTFVKSGALIAGASAVIGVGLYKAGQAYEDAHLAQLKLQNSLKNNPRLAGESADAFIRQAQALQQVTAADGDEIVAAQAMLGTFRVSGDQIRNLTPLIVDYARKFDVDLVTAAKSVGKALDGQVGALKRNGVTIDETLFKTDRYRAVQEALNGQVGGFAAREGKTFSGQMEILKNNLRDVEEAIGGGVNSVLQNMLPLVQGAASGFKGLDGAAGGTLGQLLTFATIGGGVLGVLSLITGAVLKGRENFASFAESFPKTATAMRGFALAGGVATAAFIVYDQVQKQAAEHAQQLAENVRRLSRYAGTDLLAAFQSTAGLATFGQATSAAGSQLEVFRGVAESNISTARRLRDQLKASGEDVGPFNRIIREVAAGNAQAASDTDRATGSVGKEGEAAGVAAEKMQKLVDAILAKARADLGLEGATLQAQSALDSYNKTISDPGSSPLDRANAEHSLKQAYLDVATQAAETAKAHAVNKDATAQGKIGTDAMIVSLYSMASTLAPGSPARANLEGIAAGMLRTRGNADDAIWGVNALGQSIVSLPSAKIIDLVVRAPNNVRQNPFSGAYEINFGYGWVPLTGRQFGGSVRRGQPYRVGESGRSELFVPDQDGRIVNQMQLAGSVPVTAPQWGGAGGAGMSVVVHVYGNAVYTKRLVDDIHEGLLRKKRTNGDLRLVS